MSKALLGGVSSIVALLLTTRDVNSNQNFSCGDYLPEFGSKAKLISNLSIIVGPTEST